MNVIVNIAFYDKEGTEIGNCRAFNSVTRYVQFVSYNFSEPDTEGDKDVEKGEENDSKDENEEEEGFLEKWMPECLKRNIPRILLVLVVTWGLTSDTLLSVWDVVSDYILAAKHFRSIDFPIETFLKSEIIKTNFSFLLFSEDHIYWAVLTIICTLAPSILAMISKGSTMVEKVKAFCLHLPFLQLLTHIRLQWKITKEQKEVKKFDRKSILAKIEVKVCQQKLEETTDDQTIEELKTEIEAKKQFEKDMIFEKEKSEKELNEFQSELQQFKLFEALGESYPQSILQFSIMMKRGLANFEADKITILSLITSISALLITMSGLLISLPLTIFNAKQIQFKSLSFQFLKILPLTTCIILPRMVTICTFLSLFDSTSGNAWISIVVLSIMLLIYSVSYIILINQLAKKRGERLISASVLCWVRQKHHILSRTKPLFP